MHGGAQKRARNQEIVGDEEGHTANGQKVSQALRNQGPPPATAEGITAIQQGRGDNYDGGKIEPASGSQSGEAGENQKIKANVKITANSRGKCNFLSFVSRHTKFTLVAIL